MIARTSSLWVSPRGKLPPHHAADPTACDAWSRKSRGQLPRKGRAGADEMQSVQYSTVATSSPCNILPRQIADSFLALRGTSAQEHLRPDRADPASLHTGPPPR